MKKSGAYSNRAASIMTLVLLCQLFTGTGLFCVRQYTHTLFSLLNAQTAIFETNNPHGGAYASVWNNSESGGGTLPCSCKKKCPTIPRVTLTSNPVYQFHETQRQFRSVSHDSATSPCLMDQCFAFSCASPLTDSNRDNPSHSSTPLSITCVLLI